MYSLRQWKSRRNAAGFAAECARLALPFYGGDRKSDLVAAIELTERYASGSVGSSTADAADATDAADAAYGAADAAYCAADYADYAGVNDGGAAAADAAAYAAAAVAATDGGDDACVINAAHYSGHAGVDTHELQAAFARWVVRDLSDGRELPEELRQAAGAAVVAGDEDLAKELLA